LIPGDVSHRLEGDLGGVPGAAAVVLNDAPYPSGEGGGNGLGVGWDHDGDVGDPGLLDRPHHPVDDGTARHGVQHLGQVALHAGALAGGEHDGADRHLVVLLKRWLGG
jgi:hypothetical protein